jgi:superfamily I DNA/RNA helicase
MPPDTYLTRLRVERPKALLAKGLPPAQKVLATGFTDRATLTAISKN